MKFLFKLLKSKLLTITLAAYILALVGGVAYATTDGKLEVTTNSNLKAALSAEIVSPKVDFGMGNPTANGSYGAVTKLSENTLTLSATLRAPGDTLTYSFQVKNTGKLSAEFQTPEIYISGEDPDNDIYAPLLIEGTFEDLDGYVLAAGKTSPLADIFTIEVSWDEDNQTEGDYPFTITIPYIIAIE